MAKKRKEKSKRMSFAKWTEPPEYERDFKGSMSTTLTHELLVKLCKFKARNLSSYGF